ncbi:unnamed protein product [Allacma fusca]|uniref:Cytochrome P450 n=1 Tax=Allacma fusca TaxID=39272 RepID=A0A8J2JYT4_9HEXA|nr:unnamed protein product [Allacma fusca]
MVEISEFISPFLGVSFATAFILFFAVNRNPKHRRISDFLKLLPGPRRYPIIGSCLELTIPSEDFHQLQFKQYNQYGDRFVLHSFGFTNVVISNPEDIEKLLTSSVHINKGITYKNLTPWLGQGLLTSRDERWHKHRKMLTPSFHFRILEDFIVVFNEQAQVLVNILTTEFANGQAKDICQFITRCTLDIIGETILGTKFGTQHTMTTPYFQAVKMALKIQTRRTVSPILWPKSIFWRSKLGRDYKAALEILHGFTDKIIQERKVFNANISPKNEGLVEDSSTPDIYWKGKRRLAFLDLLLDAQKNPANELTDLDIRQEVDTFMFEGHDTTSSALGWTIFLLSCHPQYQSKVHKELDIIFGEDKTRDMTSKDLVEMKYLSACIKEALRLYPSVPFLARYLTKDLVLHDGLTVPAGCEVDLCVSVIHRNEKYFPNPNEFLPDRFLPEYSPKRHLFSYIPFSAGPRNCIGQKFAMMEQKIVLANLFRNFKATAAEALEDVIVMVDIITRSKNGLKIKLSPR